uniref:Uncharacterized protein n=1 Tax=Lobelia laxiflora TaxID=252775 RepID=A0A1L6BTV9_9ASTR|nr:hypothetical protein Lo_lax1Pt0578 [Lobelia laxiflora]APQ39459.1 hypothetical protein Lo_lax1Pt0578 [Lobelia laxiflora]
MRKFELQVFHFFCNMKLDFFFGRLCLRYLFKWGLETKSVSHRIALVYLFNREYRTRNFFDRLALTYVLITDLEKNSAFDRFVGAYLTSRGLAPTYLFATLARAFVHLWRGRQPRNFFDKMALMYLLKRCDEAFDKGLSVRGFDDVFDVARADGSDLIDRHFEKISKTQRAWQLAKVAIAWRLREISDQETIDLRSTAELGYWTGALQRLNHLEKGAT